LIQVALAEVGTAETGNNETKYGKHMKADKLPWCGSFLNWCADQAGVKVPNVVSTKAGAEAFKKNKQWYETPKIGDFVFFDFIIDDKVTINHIGLVIRVSEKQIVTIEGNTSGGGDQRNGGEVMVKSRPTKRRKIMDKAKAIAASWARSYIAAALAVYMAGGDWKQIAMGGVAAVVPVILRWLNPADKAFGSTGK
jgi:hypothetical protein